MSREPNKPKRVTLRDVSQKAGVSIQTVSHVLSGNPTVTLPESTREKVRVAASEVGYQPNRHAQAVRGGKTMLISVWMPVDRPIVTYMRYLKLISERAKRDGYELMVNCLQRADALHAGGSPPTLYPVDGILSIDAGKAIQEFRKVKGNDYIPVSVLGFEQVPYGDSVTWDLDGAAKVATQSLIERGARRIAHATHDWILAEFPRERRRLGYTQAMEEAGLTPTFLSCAGDTSTEIMASLRPQLEKADIEAVFGFTDTVAIAAARAWLEMGKQIPQDGMIMGVGDFPESADFHVPISTVSLDFEQIVDRSWSWLLERMNNPGLEPRMEVQSMKLVHRASTNR